MFAKYEFDLGNFTAVEHSIDTGSAKPIKQRMRRTPMGFAEEEEAHLKKDVESRGYSTIYVRVVKPQF